MATDPRNADCCAMVSDLSSPDVCPLYQVISHPTCRARTFIFTTLAAAIRGSALDWFLEGGRPFTVFAPNDRAFGNMPLHEFEELLSPDHEDRLIEVITRHIVPGRWTSDALRDQTVRAVNGERVKVQSHRDGLQVNGAGMVRPDLPASNGLVHEIDRVLVSDGELAGAGTTSDHSLS